MVSSWRVDVPGEAANALFESLNLGPIVNEAGHRLLTEARVDRFNGFSIDIFADEHPPPHFRVSYAGETANFRITDGERLNGGLDRYLRNIRKWYKENRELLIQSWNRLRPSDCTVGEVRV
jgi:hypothetical protein